uniref:Uncharacterized protein n=1 Tax=Cucumis melo TaxID=3656 RepID=A0A9I9DW09_CUCME
MKAFDVFLGAIWRRFSASKSLLSTGSFVRRSSGVVVRQCIDVGEFPRSTGGVPERFPVAVSIRSKVEVDFDGFYVSVSETKSGMVLSV